jgi:hypothetical protein
MAGFDFFETVPPKPDGWPERPDYITNRRLFIEGYFARLLFRTAGDKRAAIGNSFPLDRGGRLIRDVVKHRAYAV